MLENLFLLSFAVSAVVAAIVLYWLLLWFGVLWLAVLRSNADGVGAGFNTASVMAGPSLIAALALLLEHGPWAGPALVADIREASVERLSG